jgi:hypothetical protein
MAAASGHGAGALTTCPRTIDDRTLRGTLIRGELAARESLPDGDAAGRLPSRLQQMQQTAFR